MYYSKYNCTPDDIDFPSFREAIDQIHCAGGHAVLAHPGDYFDNDDNFISILDALLKSAFDSGIDGIECYYYKHDENTTKACLDFCRENNLIITGGCDYHGAFISNSDIGKIEITLDMLDLGSINER